MGLWTSTTQFPMNHNSPRLYNLGTSLDRCTRSMSGKYPWFVLKKMMKGFWNILSLIHGGNLLCTQRCDQCGILVDDYRALKQASTWEQHFTVLSGHFIPTSDNFALNGGLVLGIHRESSRLGSQGSFFAPGRNTRIACYHASLHLLNMLPLSLLPLVGLMCRHGPPSSCLLIFGEGLHDCTPPWGLSVVRWLMRGRFWSSPWHWRQRLESWVLSR